MNHKSLNENIKFLIFFMENINVQGDHFNLDYFKCE